MKSLKYLICALLAAAAAANAQMSPNMAMPKAASGVSAGAAVMTEGVVQSLDKSRGVMTLKHGEITNMAMPAMIMAFNVADKKMLDKVKTGDKVRFHVENVGNAPTVTRIEPSK
jgi:Cu/Ag efflux protein CusF